MIIFFRFSNLFKKDKMKKNSRKESQKVVSGQSFGFMFCFVVLWLDYFTSGVDDFCVQVKQSMTTITE